MVQLSCMIVFSVSALRSVGGDIGIIWQEAVNPRVILPVLALCILCSIGGNLLVNYAAGQMSVAKFSAFSSLITLCSTFGGIVLLGEPFNGLFLLGTAMILLGVWQVSKAENKKE